MDNNSTPQGQASPTGYWRTRAGSHRHVSWYCANTRRSLHGSVQACTADEASDMPACVYCAPDEAPAAQAPQPQAAADEKCPNPGVTHPQRLQSTCRACGKLGKVNRSTGSIRAHKRAS